MPDSVGRGLQGVCKHCGVPIEEKLFRRSATRRMEYVWHHLGRYRNCSEDSTEAAAPSPNLRKVMWAALNG